MMTMVVMRMRIKVIMIRFCNFRPKLVYLVLLESLEFQDFRECQEREAHLDHQAPKATQ